MTAQLTPHRMSLPPPGAFDLVDGDRVVGWVEGSTFGFGGFGGVTEAAHAAWVAHRTLSRLLARRHGRRSVPIDVEPLSLARDGDRVVVQASGRPVAEIVPPQDSNGGDGSYGFAITVDGDLDELAMRSLAYRVYRTLRKSGVRWTLWSGPATWQPHPSMRRYVAVRDTSRRERTTAPSASRFVAGFIMVGLIIALAIAAVTTGSGRGVLWASALLVVALIGMAIARSGASPRSPA